MGEAKKEGKQDARKPWKNGGKKTWPPRTTPSNAPKGVLTLRFWQPNFHVYTEALSMECLTKFGNLGKLVEMGTYYVRWKSKAEDVAEMGPKEVISILFVDALKG